MERLHAIAWSARAAYVHVETRGLFDPGCKSRQITHDPFLRRAVGGSGVISRERRRNIAAQYSTRHWEQVPIYMDLRGGRIASATDVLVVCTDGLWDRS